MTTLIVRYAVCDRVLTMREADSVHSTRREALAYVAAAFPGQLGMSKVRA